MRSLVLVGAGHVHLGVLARFARRPLAGVTVTVVDPADEGAYSGALPPALAGVRPLDTARIPAPAIVHAAGGRWRSGRVVAVDEGARAVTLADGTRLPADVVSLDTGARAAIDDVEGAHRLSAVRPFGAARALDARLATLAPTADVVVVGAGAAGVELAIAIAVRRRRAGARGRVHLVDAATAVVPGWSPGARRHVHDALAALDITVTLGAGVRRVTDDGVALDDGTSIGARLVVWAAGTAPHPLALPPEAARSARGFPLVDATLRVIGTRALFGGGDGVDHAAHPALEKSGVHAVRQGAVLARNLRVACAGRAALAPWTPRTRTLALLDAGDGTAIARWGAASHRGRLALLLKRRLDDGYVARLRALAASVGR